MITTWAYPPARQRAVIFGLLAVTVGGWAYLLLLRSAMGAMSPISGMDAVSSMSGIDAVSPMSGIDAVSPMSGIDAVSPMSGMDAMDARPSMLAMPMTSQWNAREAVLMWTMWAVMMAAMMVPSATPMIRAYSTTIAPRPGSATTAVAGSTPLFVTGYLIAWAGFALVATSVQWALHDAMLVDAMGASTSRWIAVPVLVLAGVYQFTSVKSACLKQCRTPLGFLLNEWRSGRRGALVMGLRHGSLCIGCCWALMALLFVLGVMNLWWIALVAAVVLIEKITRSEIWSKGLGVALIMWGTTVVTGFVDLGVTH